MENEFSVYWWGVGDVQIEELRFVIAEKAVNRAVALIRGPAAALIERLIITDGGDCTTFEYIKGKGIVFPTDLKGIPNEIHA